MSAGYQSFLAGPDQPRHSGRKASSLVRRACVASWRTIARGSERHHVIGPMISGDQLAALTVSNPPGINRGSGPKPRFVDSSALASAGEWRPDLSPR
jgi:hypothetical protein